MPIAIAMICGKPRASITGTSVTAHRIVATLNMAGDSDGMKNRRSEFSIPIIATATATVVRNGAMTRVSSVVSSSLPGTSANSEAMSAVIGPAKRMARTTTSP